MVKTIKKIINKEIRKSLNTKSPSKKAQRKEREVRGFLLGELDRQRKADNEK